MYQFIYERLSSISWYDCFVSADRQDKEERKMSTNRKKEVAMKLMRCLELQKMPHYGGCKAYTYKQQHPITIHDGFYDN